MTKLFMRAAAPASALALLFSAQASATPTTPDINSGSTPSQAEQALLAVDRDWSQAGFSAPAKPAQAIVQGANGRTIMGADYARVSSTVRFGRADAAVGDDDQALAKFASADAVLRGWVRNGSNSARRLVFAGVEYRLDVPGNPHDVFRTVVPVRTVGALRMARVDAARQAQCVEKMRRVSRNCGKML